MGNLMYVDTLHEFCNFSYDTVIGTKSYCINNIDLVRLNNIALCGFMVIALLVGTI